MHATAAAALLAVAAGTGAHPKEPATRIKQPRRLARVLAPAARHPALARPQASDPGPWACSGNTGDPPRRPGHAVPEELPWTRNARGRRPGRGSKWGAPRPFGLAQCVTLPLLNVCMRHSLERRPDPDTFQFSYWPGNGADQPSDLGQGASSDPGSRRVRAPRTGAHRPVRAHRLRGTCRRSRGQGAAGAGRSRSTGYPAC
jgi:hypothetical protein